MINSLFPHRRQPKQNKIKIEEKIRTIISEGKKNDERFREAHINACAYKNAER